MLKYHFIVLRDTDFKAGAIMWLDELKNNRNHVSGVLPDQSIEGAEETSIPYTIINYCCRSDGFPSNPIFLPTDEPFFLFKYKTHECQQVEGMLVTEEWFKWDTEDMLPFNERTGFTPYGDVSKDVKLHYCYYQRSCLSDLCKAIKNAFKGWRRRR